MKALADQISELDGVEIYGRVVGVRGLMVEVAGPLSAMSVGARMTIETDARAIPCEVVGFAWEGEGGFRDGEELTRELDRSGLDVRENIAEEKVAAKVKEVNYE